MHYPDPLKPGSRIAVTAISSGIDECLKPRLNHVLASLTAKGFEVVEGQCLMGNRGYVSADPNSRAREFMQYATDPTIAAIIPPFGGELATELLPLLDFELLKKSPPKWIVGYSDISTITTAITACCDWATVHSACLMEMLPEQPDELTSSTLDNLGHDEMASFEQHSSTRYQNYFPSWEDNPLCLFDLNQPTQWKWLKTRSSANEIHSMRGRLFGGCLDTLVNLFGTQYLDFEKFKDTYEADGVILYLENVEYSPMGLKRSLFNFEFRKVFDGINGLILGRSTGPEDPKGMISYEEVINEFFGEKAFPVIYDADIGHRPPNMTLINGSLATVKLHNNKANVTQSLVP